MTINAFVQNRHLHIDLGDGEIFTIPPVPGRIGKEMLGIVIATAFGTDIENSEANSERLGRCAIGLPVEAEKRGEATVPAYSGLAGWEEREEKLESYRASEQTVILQAAILWNVQNGSMDAVHDLLNTEAGEAYPKALARVMRSSGLEQPFQLLRDWLSGALANPTTAANTDATTSPSGTKPTDAFETSTPTPLE